VSGVIFGGSYVAATGILIVWATRIDVRRAVRLVAAAFLFLSLGQVVGVGGIGLVIDHVGWFSGFLVSAVSATSAAGLASRAERGSAPDTAAAPPRVRGWSTLMTGSEQPWQPPCPGEPHTNLVDRLRLHCRGECCTQFMRDTPERRPR